MKNIEQYRKRFNALLESTIGDSRPLTSESPQFEEFVVPTLDMMVPPMVYADTSKTAPTIGKKITNNVKSSVSGYGYKFTLPVGMYKPNELITLMGITFHVKKTEPYLKLTTEVLSKTENISNFMNYKGIVGGSPTHKTLYFQFQLPATQEEFLKTKPYIGYFDVKCENVNGGKIRFSVEVPSGSQIG